MGKKWGESSLNKFRFACKIELCNCQQLEKVSRFFPLDLGLNLRCSVMALKYMVFYSSRSLTMIKSVTG